MTHKELAEKFQKLNSSFNMKEWYPLINDECNMYADDSKLKIKLILDNGS